LGNLGIFDPVGLRLASKRYVVASKMPFCPLRPR
jgi:hypothetical protein